MNILSIKNEKMIYINTDKLYEKKVGKMLKTYEDKYISRKVIKNEKNKLYWRHIYSLLPEEIITEIQQRIYRYIFQTKVLKIEKGVYFVKDNRYDLHNFNQEIFELHNIDLTGRNTFTNGGWNMDNPIEEQEYNRRRIKQIQEEWLMVETYKTDLFDGDKMTFYKDNRKKFYDNLKKRNSKSKKLVNAMDDASSLYFDMRGRCVGLLKNGSLCGCDASNSFCMYKRDCFNKHINHICFSEDGKYSEMIERGITREHIIENQERNHNYLFLRTCKTHINQMIDLREYSITELNTYIDKTYKQQEHLDKIYYQLGYKVRNGYMCKICPK